jgi:hypothetical protein
MIKIHKPSHNYEFESNNNSKLHMIKNKQLRRHNIMITGWQPNIYIYITSKQITKNEIQTHSQLWSL